MKIGTLQDVLATQAFVIHIVRSVHMKRVKTLEMIVTKTRYCAVDQTLLTALTICQV